jgi:DNA-binding MarR family transcriptional regulator
VDVCRSGCTRGGSRAISAMTARGATAAEHTGMGTAGPDESPGFLLWRVTLRWQRVIAAALRPMGLTHVQFVLLASVWWLASVAGEGPAQRRVADHAGTDPMMTSQVLRTLEGRGLITRELDPDDSRARRLGITSQGAELAKRAISVVEAADGEFFAAAGERRPLLRTLHRLAVD